MRALLYTRSSCSFCERARELLAAHGVEYEERSLDGDRALAQRLAQQVGVATMPYALLDGELLGGLDALRRHLGADSTGPEDVGGDVRD